MRFLTTTLLVLTMFSGPVMAEKETYMDLARKGWNYQLRTTMLGRDMSIPVQINGRNLAGSTICIVGEVPHPATRRVLETFTALMQHSYGKPMMTHYAGPSAEACQTERTVILRLYSGTPTNSALTEDIVWMNRSYLLGLSSGRRYVASSPAMAQTFFGHMGQITHIMVKQPGAERLNGLEKAFYKSILIEELFQSFTFGMDVLSFDRQAVFISKLQEIPVNLGRLPWSSQAFMRALLQSNPAHLCPFDIFMLHAVARSPVDQTTGSDFMQYIDGHYNELLDLSQKTFADPRFAPLLDEACAPAA